MLSIFIIWWLFLIIATERLTELFTASEIFAIIRDPIRDWAFPKDGPPPDTFKQRCKIKLYKLVTCGYCMSVWVAFVHLLFVPGVRYESPLNVQIPLWVNFLALHGLSNAYHVLYEWCRRGRVHTYDIDLKVTYGHTGESNIPQRAEIITGSITPGDDQESVRSSDDSGGITPVE